MLISSFTLPEAVCVYAAVDSILPFECSIQKLASCRTHSSFTGHLEQPALVGTTYRTTGCEIWKEGNSEFRSSVQLLKGGN